MENAIKDAGIVPADIEYINAHGTGTSLNDKTETMAIKRLFGEAEKNVAVSATKSMTGHSLGAIGALEAIITAKSINEGYIPPTINSSDIDPECDLSGLVLGTGINRDMGYALTNSFGFGGHNASLVIRKYR